MRKYRLETGQVLRKKMGTEGVVTADGNNLTVLLFLWAGAMTFFAAAFSQHERRVRVVFCGIAAFLAAAAVFWSPLSRTLPGLAASVAGLASNAYVWFALLMAALIVCSAFSVLRQLTESWKVSNVPPPMTFQTLKPNEIVLPESRNGVLWEWVLGKGMIGPFCPAHRVRLMYRNSYSSEEPKAITEEDEIGGGSGSLVCPSDSEEFIFLRPRSGRVRDLRTHVMAEFQLRQERKRLEEEKKSQ